MRTPRRWPWALVIVVVALSALAGTLFLPSVQRYVVLRLFPTGPGKSLGFQGLEVGVGRVHVRDSHLDWNGLKVVDARSIAREGPDAAKAAGGPFRFEGLRPLARLPVRCVLSEVDGDAPRPIRSISSTPSPPRSPTPVSTSSARTPPGARPVPRRPAPVGRDG